MLSPIFRLECLRGHGHSPSVPLESEILHLTARQGSPPPSFRVPPERWTRHKFSPAVFFLLAWSSLFGPYSSALPSDFLPFLPKPWLHTPKRSLTPNSRNRLFHPSVERLKRDLIVHVSFDDPFNPALSSDHSFTRIRCFSSTAPPPTNDHPIPSPPHRPRRIE